MGWQYVSPGIILVLVKLTGTALFVTFIPEIFPRGNFSFVSDENSTALQTTQSPPESPTDIPVRVTTAVQVPELRWESYGGQLYAFSEYTLEWSSSELECETRSSHLVIINDEQEMVSCCSHDFDLPDLLAVTPAMAKLLSHGLRIRQEFLQNRTRNADYFIGLENPDGGSKWSWLDGTEPRGDLFTMKPNEVDKECATLRGREVSPASCYDKKYWICEKKNG